MTSGWVNLSTSWALTSTQAALNVFISVLGTIGIWSFSRYWWQRSSASVIAGKAEVPLSSLFSLAAPGEGYDAVRILRRQLLSKDHLRLLMQILVILVATLACMFAGPIAKVSLRMAETVQIRNVDVTKSAGNSAVGNRLDANLEWNDTMQSLDHAKFPHDQLLNYLPVSPQIWTYVEREWDPTWRAQCKFHDEQILENVLSNGTGTFSDPFTAFPTFRETYDSSWLESSKYRTQIDFNFVKTTVEGPNPLWIQDALYWVLVQSEPTVEERMDSNNETFELSLTALNLHSFFLTSDEEDMTQSTMESWRPLGQVQKASFTRIECNFTRKSWVLDIESIPWPWTNDTWAVTFAYRTYWMTELVDRSSKNLTVATPTPQEIFRFYQAYTASVSTWLSRPSKQNLSIWMDTVQIHIVTLILLALLTLWEIWIAGRYFWFLRRYKNQLSDICIPDSRIEWMIHAAKLADQGTDQGEVSKFPGRLTTDEESVRQEDRDYFNRASFGRSNTTNIARPQLARVYTSSRTSFSTASNRSRSQSRSKSSARKLSKQGPTAAHRRPSSPDVHKEPNVPGPATENRCNEEVEIAKRATSNVKTQQDLAEDASESPQVVVEDDTSCCGVDGLLRPTMSRSSVGSRTRSASRGEASSSGVSFASIIRQEDEE